MGTREHPDMTQLHRVTRLNPFAFPPETNVRFALLLAAAVALALNLTLLTFGQIGLLDVTLASPDGLLLVDEATGQVEIDRVRLGELQTSVFAGWLIIGLSCAYGLALFGAAWLIHRRHPRRIARRKGLDPWPEGRDPDFISALADLCRRAGVDPPPDILVATGSGLTDGQVFGFRRRYSLRLGSRMPLLMRKRPEKFRAVILHELGHIVNGDVARTYFTQALWITVLIVAVLPVTAFIVYNVTDATLLRLNALASGGDLQLERLFFVNIPIWLLIGGQFTLIVLIVGLIRAGLLREREMYADWRAALWGARTTIAGILQAHASHDEERHGPFSLHPDPAARLETLRDPARLFHLRLDVPLIAGIMPATMISVVAQFAALISLALSGITLIPVLVLVDSLVTQSPETVLRLLNITLGAQLVMLLVVGGLPVIALGTLVAGTLGLQVERDAIAGLALGQGRGIIPYIRLLVPSAVFTLGVLIGLALTPIGLFMPLSLLIGSDVGLGSLVRILLETAVWFTAITALMWGWLCVTRFSAHRVLGTHVGEKPPRLKRQVLNLWLGLVMGGALLAAAVAQVLIYRDVAGLVNSLGPPLSAVGLVAAMYVITVIGVWALTRVGLLLRRRCPTCGERVRTPIAVGATCDSCDSKLAPWAYID